MWAWFIGTKAGRIVLEIGAVIALLSGIALKFYFAGKRVEKAKQTQENLENLRKRSKSDEEVNSMPADARRNELSGWVRDE